MKKIICPSLLFSNFCLGGIISKTRNHCRINLQDHWVAHHDSNSLRSSSMPYVELLYAVNAEERIPWERFCVVWLLRIIVSPGEGVINKSKTVQNLVTILFRTSFPEVSDCFGEVSDYFREVVTIFVKLVTTFAWKPVARTSIVKFGAIMGLMATGGLEWY